MTFGLFYACYFAAGLILNAIALQSKEAQALLKELYDEKIKQKPETDVAGAALAYFIGQIIGCILAAAVAGPIPHIYKLFVKDSKKS